jgi:hypothetical protein
MSPAPTCADLAFLDAWDLVRTELFAWPVVCHLIDDLADQSLQVGPHAQMLYWRQVQEAVELLALGHFTAAELHYLAGRRAGPDKPSWQFYLQACGGPPGWPYGLTAKRVRGPSKATIRRAVSVTAARIGEAYVVGCNFAVADAMVAKAENVPVAAVRQSLSRVTRWLTVENLDTPFIHLPFQHVHSEVQRKTGAKWKYSGDFRDAAVQVYIETHHSLTEVARQLGVSRTAYKGWVKRSMACPYAPA